MKVHPYITCLCTFWQSAFSVTCFGRFFLGSGNKCRWYWNGMCLRMCVVWVSICTPVSIRKAFACMCTGGGGGGGGGRSLVKVSYVTGT